MLDAVAPRRGHGTYDRIRRLVGCLFLCVCVCVFVILLVFLLDGSSMRGFAIGRLNYVLRHR